MKILVTGGAGFIGSQVAQALLERGDEVVVVDNLNDYYDVQLKKDRLAQIEERLVKFYPVDFADYDVMKKIFSEHKFDKICHLGAQAGVRYSLINPHAYHRTNGEGTLNILELMKEFGVKDLVFASSSSVYGGNTVVPFSTEHRVDTPVSLYAATKKYNELMAHVYHDLYGLNCWGLRFFTVYGPWGRPDMALFKFTKNILADKPIDVYNHGDHERDFTYITDIVSGILAALDKVNGYDVFNLGNNDTVTLMHFISCIENALGKTAQKNMLPMQKGDVHKTYADIERTKQILGWEPTTNIEDGINKFIQWYKEYHEQKKVVGVSNGGIERIAVVGLGYVGLPLALELSKHYSILGFDVDEDKVNNLQQGIDLTGEVSLENLQNDGVTFSCDETKLKKADVVIVCVPTPIDDHKKPDLKYVKSASGVVGRNLKEGGIVVYESTVYPGVTEEVCVPILEKMSGLKFGEGFKVGYSPERMNPGDKEHSVNKIVKVVAGMDNESLEKIDSVYSKITKTHKASSIKVAEAAKVIENIQRDLNIALMNELAIIFDKMDIDVHSVLEAAGTKWNFHKYIPGLVGGHCIGVDPYYLTYKAEGMGYHPQVILAGRQINDNMHKFYFEKIMKRLARKEKNGERHSVLVLGLTFKPNVKDYRNSRVKHLIEELKGYNVDVSAYDPHLSKEVVEDYFGADFFDPRTAARNFDFTLMAVEHDSLNEMIDGGKLSGSVVKLKEL